MNRLTRYLAAAVVFILIPIAVVILGSGGCIPAVKTESKPAVLAAVGKTGEDTQYYVLYSDGGMKKTDPFELDRAEVSFAGSDVFSSSVKDGKIAVVLSGDMLTDENGAEICRAEGTKLDILKAAAQEAEHDIFSLEIIHSAGRYYVFEKLNVNMWTPCRLFVYDERNGKLTLLGEWDDVELEGLAQPE